MPPALIKFVEGGDPLGRQDGPNAEFHDVQADALPTPIDGCRACSGLPSCEHSDRYSFEGQRHLMPAEFRELQLPQPEAVAEEPLSRLQSKQDMETDGMQPNRPAEAWLLSQSEYALTDQEGINSLSLVDLLIQEQRPAVVDALHELATATQQAVASEPDNAELQDYAYSLAWHYFCLRGCNELDGLIKKVMTKKEQAKTLESTAESFRSRFDCAMAEVGELERFVQWQPGGIPVPLWPEWPRNQLKSGGLAPTTVASLSRTVPETGVVEFLDGVIKLLGTAPWVRRRSHSFFEEYFADPGQRIEFQAACEALLPKIEDLKRSTNDIASLNNVRKDMVAARAKVEFEWNKARQNQKLPPTLGDLAKKVIDRHRARAP